MTPDETAARICSTLEERGYCGAALPTEHVTQLKLEIEERLSRKEIDAGLYERYLTYFRFDVTAILPGARSVIITAAPQPQRKATFQFHGQRYSGIIPPTYYHDTDDPIREILQSDPSASGCQFQPAPLPAKLLAVRGGMAEYGKNNVAYVEGMGSFLRFRAFLSNMPAGRSAWTEPRVMKQCDGCQACLKACPTRAIVPDRFLIHAERCITYLNESTDDFPEWIDPAWHNSLIGCMRCQLACPVNKRFAKRVEAGESFNESETGLILNGVTIDRMPPETAHKLTRSNMSDYLDVLPRNLRVLMK